VKQFLLLLQRTGLQRKRKRKRRRKGGYLRMKKEFEEEMRKKWEKVVRVEMGAMKGCLRAVLQMMSRTS